MNWHAAAGVLAFACGVGAFIAVCSALDESGRERRNWFMVAVTMSVIAALLMGFVAS